MSGRKKIWLTDADEAIWKKVSKNTEDVIEIKQVALPSGAQDVRIEGNILVIGPIEFKIAPKYINAIHDKILKGGTRFPDNMEVWYRATTSILNQYYEFKALTIQGDKTASPTYKVDIEVDWPTESKLCELGKDRTMLKWRRFVKDDGEYMELNFYYKPDVSFMAFERGFKSEQALRNYRLPGWADGLGLIEMSNTARFSDKGLATLPERAQAAFIKARTKSH